MRITPPHVFRYDHEMTDEEATAAAVRDAREKLEPVANQLAALVMEPLMQGAAGMWAQPVEYLQSLSELCRRHGILLILDEVATGFGRTGRMFACEHAGVVPDLLCLAKGITGGYLPLAATLAREEVYSVFLGAYREYKAFFHGHTYTGNPLGCAAALANLDLFERNDVLGAMQGGIRSLESRLREIRELPHVSDVRQWGYMAGIELVEEKQSRKSYLPERRIGHKVILEARKRGVLIRPLGDVVILMPPLTITAQQLTMLLDVVYESIRAVTEE